MNKGLQLLTGQNILDTASYAVTVGSTSKTITELVTAASGTVPTATAAVTITTGDGLVPVRYNPAGAASAANAALPAGSYSTAADADLLDTMELYAASNVEVGIILHGVA